jgi:hypothetical protein
MSRTRAWFLETPRPIIQGSHLASSLSEERVSVTFSGCPYREGRVQEGARAVSWAAPMVDTPI